mgnify:CR=1 FL=1
MPERTFAIIAFPTAVRRTFTYHVPEGLQSDVKRGKRVWVPLRQHFAIGMVVRVHDEKPDFETREVRQVLDEEPVMNPELLSLTDWVHRFYYASWGETIQAALPVGLNFRSRKYLVTAEDPGMGLGGKALEIYNEIKEAGEYPLDDAEKRWSEGKEARLLDKLRKQNLIETWEQPSVKVKPKKVKVWNWTGEASGEALDELIDEYSSDEKDPPKWVRALQKLRSLELPASQKELNRQELLEYYTLHRIRKERLIDFQEIDSHQVRPKLDYDPSQLKTLNDEQQEACERILDAVDEERFESFLLYGVTGSGKTEVYIHALKRVIEQGRGGLILVPEIALTPQTVRRFYQIFGDDIAVLHSRLSNCERYDAWRALHSGEKRVAIGARSAIFAPVQDLGLIIIDEEHDSSYKQEDPAPRYDARLTGRKRAELNNAVMVTGSATPSMVSLQASGKGNSHYLELSSRHAEAEMPGVEVLDLKKYRSAMRGPLAVPLHDSIQEALDKDQQVILLYNRRGYASYLQCGDCGHLPECPNCSVSLTYHKNNQQLRCHYCGFASRASGQCPDCKAQAMLVQGSGTQQIEEQIEEQFSDARLLRMDQDTTTGKNAHAELLQKFDDHEADILLGTQLVAKGLDFPNVTVVGVIDADTELAFPSFRSAERMYQLLSQVAGRSGRADKPGVVYFQTWQPDHPAVQSAREHDYKGFARTELQYRKMLEYPPYSRLISFIFKGSKEYRVQQVATAFTHALEDEAGGFPVLGPSPLTISRMKNEFRWETITKIDTSWQADQIEQMLDRIFEKYDQQKPEGATEVRITVNVDAME